MISEQRKESIITEYLTTEISFRALGQKHGIDFRMVHEWVQRYKGKMKSKPDKPKRVKPISNPNELPSDVKLLQAELRKARLLNEMLTEVINITEVELGRSIRKKSGIKAVLKVEQSKPNRTIRELCSLLGYSTQAYYKFHRATTFWGAEGTYPTPYGVIKLKHIKLPSGEIASEIEAPKEIKIIR